jgi:hypothetical protein
MSRWKRKLMVGVAVAATGIVTQFSGCGEYWAYAGATGVNFCSILNCEDNPFFDFCGANPLLVDCPNAVTDTTTT